MKLDKEQMEEFEALTRPLMAWMGKNCHPHSTIVMSSTVAELSEGVATMTMPVCAGET